MKVDGPGNAEHPIGLAGVLDPHENNRTKRDVLALFKPDLATGGALHLA